MNIPLNIDWQQIFLHLFNFVILAGGLYILLYKPVKDFMDKRTKYYEDMEAEANNRLEKAKETEELYQAKMLEVEAEINTKRIETTEKAENEADEIISIAKKQAEKVVSDAREYAEKERQKILDSTKQEIVELAVLATEKLMQQAQEETLGGEVHEG